MFSLITFILLSYKASGSPMLNLRKKHIILGQILGQEQKSIFSKEVV